jgi:hypothetical protein
MNEDELIDCWELKPGMTFNGKLFPDVKRRGRWRLIREANEIDHPTPGKKLSNARRNKWIASPVKYPTEQYLCCFDMIMERADLKWKDAP